MAMTGVTLSVICGFFCAQGCAISASRLAFAYARDGLLPASSIVARVDKRVRAYSTPIRPPPHPNLLLKPLPIDAHPNKRLHIQLHCPSRHALPHLCRPAGHRRHIQYRRNRRVLCVYYARRHALFLRGGQVETWAVEPGEVEFAYARIYLCDGGIMLIRYSLFPFSFSSDGIPCGGVCCANDPDSVLPFRQGRRFECIINELDRYASFIFWLEIFVD